MCARMLLKMSVLGDEHNHTPYQKTMKRGNCQVNATAAGFGLHVLHCFVWEHDLRICNCLRVSYESP
jgi:hypothetical protein